MGVQLNVRSIARLNFKPYGGHHRDGKKMTEALIQGLQAMGMDAEKVGVALAPPTLKKRQLTIANHFQFSLFLTLC